MIKKSQGLTLIEVLVTMIIIAVGLLGLLGLQAKSLSGHKDTMDRKAAAELISQMGERMRANHLGFMRDEYTESVKPGDPLPAGPACGTTTSCNYAEIAQLDKANWFQGLRKRLPDSGAYLITSPGAGASMAVDGQSVRITVAWREAQDAVFTDDACTNVGITNTKYRCLAAEVFP